MVFVCLLRFYFDDSSRVIGVFRNETDAWDAAMDALVYDQALDPPDDPTDATSAEWIQASPDHGSMWDVQVDEFPMGEALEVWVPILICRDHGEDCFTIGVAETETDAWNLVPEALVSRHYVRRGGDPSSGVTRWIEETHMGDYLISWFLSVRRYPIN